jgi:hypothetical protein
MPRDIDTEGGEYISLQITVNGNLVFQRDCVLTKVRPNGNRRYKVDDTDFFTLNPRNGPPNRNLYAGIGKRLLENKRNRRRPGDPQDDGRPDPRPPKPKAKAKAASSRNRRR